MEQMTSRSASFRDVSSIGSPARTENDSSSLPLYQYVDLDKNDIRFLTIEKDSWDTPQIHCHIGSQPIYSLFEELGEGLDAVSYVWGRPNLTSYIIIDHHSKLPVTPHLFKILQKLRQTTRNKLWIDAICINQQDDVEKSFQLTHMSEIYRQAGLVHVILGDSLSMRTVHESPFWQRRWVVQEILLAKQIRIHLSLRRGSRHLDSSTGLEENRRLVKLLAQNQSLIDLMNAKSRFGSMKYPKIDLSIFNLLIVFRKTCCVDARDRLFALLAAADDVCPDHGGEYAEGATHHAWGQCEKELHFSTDYSKSVEEAYRAFAREALRWPNYQSRILDYAVHLPNSKLYINTREPRKSRLPSWVPDWRVPDRDAGPEFFGVLPASRCNGGAYAERVQELQFTGDMMTCSVFVIGSYEFRQSRDRWSVNYSAVARHLAAEHLSVAWNNFELCEDNLEEASCKNPQDGDLLVWLRYDPHLTVLRPSEASAREESAYDQTYVLIGRLQLSIAGFPFFVRPSDEGAYELWLADEIDVAKPYNEMQRKFLVGKGLETIGII